MHLHPSNRQIMPTELARRGAGLGRDGTLAILAGTAKQSKTNTAEKPVIH
jgi:hypothetical protein